MIDCVHGLWLINYGCGGYDARNPTNEMFDPSEEEANRTCGMMPGVH